jgi:hypothetical protein
VRWLVAVLTVAWLAGCATHGDVGDVRTGETPPYALPAGADDADRYGAFGVAPLRVVRGSPTELTVTLAEGGVPAPAGTPHYVTVGFAAGRPSPVDAIDSLGGEHPALRVLAAGGLRPCEVDVAGYAVCRVYVMPPGTELVGLVLRDMS